MQHRYTILFLIMLPLGVFSQVGVNTTAPQQALDVNGKIAVGNDNMTPTVGTIRFDGSEEDFQGYDGKEWKSFTQKSSGGLPGNEVRLITAWSESIEPGRTVSILFDERTTNEVVTTPLNGEYFLITAINVVPEGFGFESGRFKLALGASTVRNSPSGNSDNVFIVTGDLADQNFTTSETPLLVVGPNEYLYALAYSGNAETVTVQVRGYWVDNLDY